MSIIIGQASLAGSSFHNLSLRMGVGRYVLQGKFCQKMRSQSHLKMPQQSPGRPPLHSICCVLVLLTRLCEIRSCLLLVHGSATFKLSTVTDLVYYMDHTGSYSNTIELSHAWYQVVKQ